MATLARRRRYVGDAVPAAYETSWDPTAQDTAYTGTSDSGTALPSTTTADLITEINGLWNTGEWITVPNPGSSMNDLASNIWTGQPTPNQMNLSAQAAAQQMAQAGGNAAQQAAAAAEALKQMQDNPAPNSPGFFGLSAEAWIMLAVVGAAALFFVKK